jgi:hypothetical protein
MRILEVFLSDAELLRGTVSTGSEWLEHIATVLRRAAISSRRTKYWCPVDEDTIYMEFEKLNKALGGKHAYLLGGQLSYAGAWLFAVQPSQSICTAPRAAHVTAPLWQP